MVPFAAGCLVGFVLTIAGLLLWARAAEPVEGEWERMSRKDFGDRTRLPPTFRDSTIADFHGSVKPDCIRHNVVGACPWCERETGNPFPDRAIAYSSNIHDAGHSK